jgi:predicted nuclease of restriction endonuclease-like (RecB) superfamily
LANWEGDLDQRKSQSWGSKVIEKLAQDLKTEFSTMKGFSTTNLKYMASFAENYPELLVIGQESLDQFEESYFVNEKLRIIFSITWYHNLCLLHDVKGRKERLWYAEQVVKDGWSRNVLSFQIKSNLYDRQAKKEIKVNNFQITLPSNDSDLANDIFKDEYNFEFIDNAQGGLKERALENALIDDVIKFLTELGKGFAFVGKQYHVEVDDEDYFIDLLFYHLELRCFIVIELKTTKFKPEYAGKMAFYLSQVDKKLKKKNDSNSIGIILCPESKNKQAQETINFITKPMGVAGYQLAEDKKELPKELKPLSELQKLMK